MNLDAAILTRRDPTLKGGVEQVVRAVSGPLRSRLGAQFHVIHAFDRTGGVERWPIVGDILGSLRLAVRAQRLHPSVVFVEGSEQAWALVLLRRFRGASFAVVCVWYGGGRGPITASVPKTNWALRIYLGYALARDRLALLADGHLFVDERLAKWLERDFGYTGPYSVCPNVLEPQVRAMGRALPVQ